MPRSSHEEFHEQSSLPMVWLNPARKLLAGCIAFCDSDSCAKLFADGWPNPARKLLAGCIAFCDSDSCAKLLADGVAKSCAKPSKPISRNHCPTRRTRPARPTSPFAKREAQGFPLRHLQSAKLTGRRFAALDPSGAAGWAVKVLHGTHGVRRKMPPEFAEVVEMVRCGEISGREAAQLCGMSHSTFRERMRKFRADQNGK